MTLGDGVGGFMTYNRLRSASQDRRRCLPYNFGWRTVSEAATHTSAFQAHTPPHRLARSRKHTECASDSRLEGLEGGNLSDRWPCGEKRISLAA